MAHAIQTLARRDDRRILLHIAYLPPKNVESACVALSQHLNDKCYPASFYRLVAREIGNPSPQILTGKDSLAHATFMHVWVTPEEAARIIFLLQNRLQRRPFQTSTLNVRGIERFSNPLPRFNGKEGEKDFVEWINIAKDPKMEMLQSMLHGTVTEVNCEPITGIGENWYPHMTEVVEPEEDARQTSYVQEKNGLIVPMGRATGTIVYGLSGPNGQLRTIIGELVADDVPLRPSQKMEIVRRIEERTRLAA